MLLNRLKNRMGGRQQVATLPDLPTVQEAAPVAASPASTPAPVRQTPRRPPSRPDAALRRASSGRSTAAVDTGVAQLLIDMDRAPETNRMGTQAESQLIHVSSLPEVCPRAVALTSWSGGNVTTTLRPTYSNDRMIWAMGRAAEREIRDRVIPAMGLGRVIGVWECPCGADTDTYCKGEEEYRPCQCGRKQVSTYKELPMVDTEAGIIGNADLPYRVEGEVVITEIKSIKGDDFQRLPDKYEDLPNNMREMAANHTFQSMSYRRLYQRNGHAVAPYTRILYASKNAVRRVPYREYVVPVTREIERRLDEEWGKARVIKMFFDTGVIPPKLNCCNCLQATRAKNCPMVTLCFSRRD